MLKIRSSVEICNHGNEPSSVQERRENF